MKIRRALSVFAIVLAVIVNSVWATPLTDGKRVTLELEEAPIITVLNLIAKQNELNLVVSGDVTGEVTMRLKDVDIAAALEAILSPNGYNYYLRDDIIVVKPVDLFTDDELITRTIRLRYADAKTVADALGARKSARGQVLVLGATDVAAAVNKLPVQSDQILITDYPRMVDLMLSLAQELDAPRKLISIEVKLIETNIDDETRLGVSWPSKITGTLGDAANGTTTTSTTTNGTSSTTTSLAVLKDLNRSGWTWGTLGVEQLSIMLDFLEQNDNSKLVSDPRITTLENHEAEIKLETVIPIPTISRFTEGASTADIQTFEDESVGITLRVTPRINETGKITMDVFPQVQEIIGYAGPADSQKPITTSRSVRTRITVNDGETAVLGGLVKEDQIERVKKVPILGSIPLLGKLLFTNKTTQSSKTDLIILITPTVLP